MDMYQKRKMGQEKKKMIVKKVFQRFPFRVMSGKMETTLKTLKYKAFNTNTYYIFLAFLYR